MKTSLRWDLLVKTKPHCQLYNEPESTLSYTRPSLKKQYMKAGEMVQRVKVLAVKVERPEFDPHDPHKNGEDQLQSCPLTLNRGKWAFPRNSLGGKYIVSRFFKKYSSETSQVKINPSLKNKTTTKPQETREMAWWLGTLPALAEEDPSSVLTTAPVPGSNRLASVVTRYKKRRT